MYNHYWGSRACQSFYKNVFEIHLCNFLQDIGFKETDLEA